MNSSQATSLPVPPTAEPAGLSAPAPAPGVSPPVLAPAANLVAPPGTGFGFHLKRLLPGVLVALLVGAVSYLVAQRTPAMSPLIWSVLIGAVIANTGLLPKVLGPGIAFAAKQLLRLAVGFLGLRLALSQVLAIGPTGVLLVLAAVVGTFAFTFWLGKRFALPRPLAAVLAAGTSICGAAAIVAISGAVDAREEDTAVGVGAVTLYGTLAMLLYPLLGSLFHLSAGQFGLWAGASIHEVAQVVAAAFSFGSATGSPAAAELATVVKLGRVLMLAPMALALSLLFRRKEARASGARVPLMPWFIVLFIATMALRSFNVLPAGTVDGLVKADTFLLAVAMAGLGLDLKWSKIRAAGLKPLYVTGLATLFIGIGTFAWVKVVG